MIDITALYRFRAVLQIAVPVIVAADTLYSFYRCHRLWQQRLQEWQEEEDALVFQKVVQTLHGVAQRCQQKDKDFWPSGIASVFKQHRLSSAEHASQLPSNQSPAVDTSNQQPQADFLVANTNASVNEHAVADTAAFLQCLGLVPLEEEPPDPEASSPLSSTDAKVAAVSVVSTLLQDGVTADLYGGEAQEAHEQLINGSTSSNSGWWHFLLTTTESLKAAGSSIAAVINGMGQPAEVACSMQSALAEEYHRQCSRLDDCINAAAEVLRKRALESVPWPEAHLQRRSALRYRVEWYGMRWPQRAAKNKGLEVVLDGL